MSWFSKNILGIVSGGLGLWSAKKSADNQASINQQNLTWQERMSNTAHQREIKDLMAAGLNPILSGLGGSGASTPVPVTSAYTGYGSDISSGLNAAANLGNAATNRKAQVAQQALSEAQIRNIGAETYKARMEGRMAKVTADSFQLERKLQLSQLVSNLALTASQTGNFDANTNLTNAKTATEAFMPDKVLAETQATRVSRDKMIAEMERIRTLLPYEVSRMQSETAYNWSMHDKAIADSIVSKVLSGKYSAETIQAIVKTSGIGIDNFRNYLKSKEEEIENEKYLSGQNYNYKNGLVTPTINQILRQVGESVGYLGSGIRFFK
jgi:hypothetical protein